MISLDDAFLTTLHLGHDKTPGEGFTEPGPDLRSFSQNHKDQKRDRKEKKEEPGLIALSYALAAEKTKRRKASPDGPWPIIKAP
jgi:hypothetical protein